MRDKLDEFDLDIKTYLRKSTEPYTSKEAKTAKQDESILSLCKSINLKSPKLIIDFGCGQGRLLAALEQVKPKKELANLRYIGVDNNSKALEKCKETFLNLQLPSEARASFLSVEYFLSTNYYIADYIIVIFTVHELNVIKIDIYLASLWRMLRRGGRLIIQDSYKPIYKELEYICFSPNEIKSILNICNPIVKLYSIKSGKSRLPIYTLSFKKNTEISTWDAYEPVNLTGAYLKTIERSINKELYELYNFRLKISEGKKIKEGHFLRVIHRIACKARAYHQTKGFTLLDKGIIDYCMKCGTEDISLSKKHYGYEDTKSMIIIECGSCGYVHKKEENPVTSGHKETELTDLYRILDSCETNDSEGYKKYVLKTFLLNNSLIIGTVEFLLDLIKGVKEDTIMEAKRILDLHLQPDSIFINAKTGEMWTQGEDLKRVQDERRKLGFGTYFGSDTS
jgi:ubiquinone/menaquinone biosynthesis C-methylase UbiE/DNA-directed RNA polymerase subunit M/transcription elongation factor TFIIS